MHQTAARSKSQPKEHTNLCTSEGPTMPQTAPDCRPAATHNQKHTQICRPAANHSQKRTQICARLRGPNRTRVPHTADSDKSQPTTYTSLYTPGGPKSLQTAQDCSQKQITPKAYTNLYTPEGPKLVQTAPDCSLLLLLFRA